VRTVRSPKKLSKLLDGVTASVRSAVFTIRNFIANANKDCLGSPTSSVFAALFLANAIVSLDMVSRLSGNL